MKNESNTQDGRVQDALHTQFFLGTYFNFQLFWRKNGLLGNVTDQSRDECLFVGGDYFGRESTQGHERNDHRATPNVYYCSYP